MSDRTQAIPLALVDAARGGDRAAVRALVEAAYPVVRRWALVQTGDPMEADDLTQDVLIRMIQTLDAFRGGARLETWLYAMTRNAAIDRARARRRARRFSDDPRAVIDLAPPTGPDAVRAAELSDLRRVLETFFEELPPRQREVFDLVELQGRPATEAAEILGIEAVTARAHLFKARRRMRARILEERPEVAEEYR